MLTDEDTRSQEQADVRSGVYGFLAAVLRYPDRQTLALLHEPGRWSGWIETLARTDPGLGKLLADLRSGLPSGQDDAQLADLQESHVVLFGHAVRGTCPPGRPSYPTAVAGVSRGRVSNSTPYPLTAYVIWWRGASSITSTRTSWAPSRLPKRANANC